MREVLREHRNFAIYDLDYDADGSLVSLEAFTEGTFRVGKLKVERRYIRNESFVEEKKKGLGDKYTFYTRMTNTENQDNPVAQIGFVHGFSECSDTWFEMAYQLALNNFDVHMIDLEGYGWSAGARGKGPKIPNLHFNVTVLIEQFREGVPTFLWGNSMGCMVLNTFLLQNPHLKLAGVIFGSPFFEISEELELDAAKRFMLSTLAEGLEVS